MKIFDYIKKIWKRKIKEAIKRKNEKELREKMTRYKKLDKLKEETYSINEYLKEMHVDGARTFFRMRTKMLKPVKMNQTSSRQHSASLWQCTGCGSVDTQAHILWCPAYQPLRERKSLNSD